MTVDGEAKTAKTTAGKAIFGALQSHGLSVYEADAGAFFRLLTICVLELLGYQNLDEDARPIPDEELNSGLPKVIAGDLAYTKREWPSLQSVLVEKYVSVIGNTTLAQDAMDHWYKKTLDAATAGSYDALVINARNPRSRLQQWDTPTLDLSVYCDPEEAARRILKAKGVASPSDEQLKTMTEDVKRRRYLDRHKDKYPYVEPKNVLSYDGTDVNPAEAVVAKSWDERSAGSGREDLPVTIRLDTTHISLDNTQAIVAALAIAAYEFARASA